MSAFRATVRLEVKMSNGDKIAFESEMTGHYSDSQFHFSTYAKEIMNAVVEDIQDSADNKFGRPRDDLK